MKSRCLVTGSILGWHVGATYSFPTDMIVEPMYSEGSNLIARNVQHEYIQHDNSMKSGQSAENTWQLKHNAFSCFLFDAATFLFNHWAFVQEGFQLATKPARWNPGVFRVTESILGWHVGATYSFPTIMILRVSLKVLQSSSGCFAHLNFHSPPGIYRF